ncbi:thiol-disulfide isomerase [Vibrio sp. 10N.286.49.B3]|uniref:thiol-disulfide isomerase n=1 Tax=Vibrio sp. 10N.286.49.B3 TaxID=1880855 RepID=UPI000C863B29|nr:thiol-disulfide isomerase [Vibrio sp. 10N.286.49.B3]PMH37109.1 thiol-disulfide isomerase [Vibrio sp. 10N.286.49.B3]
MLKTISKFALIATSCFAVIGCSEEAPATQTTTASVPQEGVQYQRLPNDLSQYNLPPVTEIFSLTCGHCRQMEDNIPTLEQLTSHRFGKMHVIFNESAQIAAIIYYTAEMQLGETPDHDFMIELFAAVQMGGDVTPEEQQAAISDAFESRQLVSPYNLSPEQQEQLFPYLDMAQNASVDGEINSVPTFIVQGQYQVITGGHENISAMADTITYLLNKKD